MLWLAILATLGPPQKCNSSIFGYRGDKLAGGKALYLRRHVNPKVDIGIAHRTLPLGSMAVVVCPKCGDGGTYVIATVVDRGPYGRLTRRGRWYNGARDARRGRHRRGSRYRGCVDLTPRAAKLLRHDGWERIELYRIPDSGIGLPGMTREMLR